MKFFQNSNMRNRYFGSFEATLLVISLFNGVILVAGHGRLMNPPARNSMWRYGYPNPVDYNDNELFCGGYAVQWEQNGGKCGVCGDPHQLKSPRPHEAGGEFGRGIISRHYFSGQIMDIEIELTANHRGRFEIYLCPNNNPRYEATESCFDRFPLYILGTRDVRYLIPPDSRKKDTFYYQVRLPPYLTCTQCVLQWTYYTGNMWGTCADGTEGLGCGKAETFRNCADIAIVNTASGLPPQFVHIFSASLVLQDFYNTKLAGPQVAHPLVVKPQTCSATATYRIIPGMDTWCEQNCLNYPPVCPKDFCTCPDDCYGIGEIEGRAGSDEYCQDQCVVFGGKCPRERCACYYSNS